MLNPITAEVIRHSLLSIPKQIEVNITRTAYSPLVYEYKDYAVGIVDPEGRLISDSQGGIPLFVANALGVAVRDGLLVHGRDGIAPGDVLFSNHASTLGQHLNNVVMYTPIYVDEELVGFMAVLVHWVDVGGITVGSCAPVGTSEIFQEGIQFRSVKLWSRGEPVRDIYRIIEVNTRFPRMLFGDLEAQLAGCLLGRDLVVALARKYGLDTVRAAIEVNWDRSERVARAAIREMPDGEYRAASFLDSDGHDLSRPVPIEILVKVEGDELTVDFSGISEQVQGAINSGRDGGAVTAARIAFKYLATPDEPANDGAFRPLKVVIPDGKFLSARPGAPMAMYSTPLPTVIDTIMKAMVQAAPGKLAAGHHGNFGIHNFEGVDPKTGERFFNLNSMQGGWGGSLDCDGPGPFKTLSHGDTLDVPTEVHEALYPIRIERHAIREDSAGAGQFRGGFGLEKVITALAPCTVQLNVDRTKCPPWGVLGGADAPPPTAQVALQGGPAKEMLKGIVPLTAGDQVRMLTSGGGGYGDPRRRDAQAVARDVQLGIVSRAAARTAYGVAIDETNAVLAEETASLRAHSEDR